MKAIWTLVGLVCLLVVSPSAVRAEFSYQEQLELRNLLAAQRDVYTALFYEAYAIRGGGWNTASHGPLIGAMRVTATVMRDINYAASILLNVVTEQVQTPPYEAFEALSRTDRVLKAFARVDRAITGLASADTWLASAAAVNQTDK